MTTNLKPTEKNMKIGDTFQAVLVKDLKRTQIVQYAGASGDYNPIHTDEIFATKVAGYPTVFAHGMLTMGITAKLITDLVGSENIKSYGARFTQQVFPGDDLTAKAEVTKLEQIDNQQIASLSIITSNQNDQIVLKAKAEVII